MRGKPAADHHDVIGLAGVLDIREGGEFAVTRRMGGLYHVPDIAVERA